MAKVSTIREKIAHLLALAESPEPAEAKAALLRARELMAKHKIRPEECVDTRDEKVVRDILDVTCTAMTNPWIVALSGIIAENYCCRAFRTRRRGGKLNAIGLIGLEDDFQVCKRVFLYAVECVTSYCKNEIKRSPSDMPGAYRERCNAYGWGFTSGVKKAFQTQQEQHQEWGLVMVVPKQVEDVFRSLGKPTRFGSVKGGEDSAQYRAKGYADGKKFDPAHRIAAEPERMEIGGTC